jgi:AICAR transformylase/IMP cyclohydrolase PurH
MVTEREAILSVAAKTGIDSFAAHVSGAGYRLWATSGTAEAMHDTAVSGDLAGLLGCYPDYKNLARTAGREQVAGLLSTVLMGGDSGIGLVAVNLSRHPSTQNSFPKGDYGGRALLQAAAEQHCIVVSSPDQYEAVADWLQNEMPQKEAFLRGLGARAEAEVAAYSAALAVQRITSPNTI